MTLTIFQFENRSVRFVGTAEKPEWVAQDVCNILELPNVSQALSSLDKDEKGIINRDSAIWQQLSVDERAGQMLTLTEAGLYRLIFKSRKPVAKRFQRWVFHEVLPAIRQTGTYSAQTVTNPTVPQLPAEPTVEEISSLFAGMASLGINPALIESAKLTAIAKSIPKLADAAEEGKRLLSSQLIVPETPVSPTELGKAIARIDGGKAPSARIVNQALINAGLQVAEKFIDKHDKPKINYHLTEAGKQYGEMVMDTARGHGKTVFHVRWFSSVIPIVVQYLEGAE